ncbi:MAG: hypothetical protein ABI238_01600 [Terrimesophilobacter sp.]
MGKTVNMRGIEKAIADYGFAYLITVADGDRIHTSVVQPTVEGECLIVPSPSDRVQANTGQRPKISLVWPPREPDGYSLIVDGVAQFGADNLRVIPSRAILHRPDIIAAPDGDSCVADCIEI